MMLDQVHSSQRTHALFFAALPLTMFPSLTRPTARAAPAALPAHPMGCDAQDWWTSTPGPVWCDSDVGDGFGHLHIGLCCTYFLVQN